MSIKPKPWLESIWKRIRMPTRNEIIAGWEYECKHPDYPKWKRK